MKLLHRSFGFIFSIAMILILFVTAFDIAVYGNYGFFQKEYEKYEVLDDLNMEMDDVMEVTAHMMDYLRDRNDDMQIVTTVGGQQQEFFNGQDIFHMDEVKVLFLGMFKIRTISTIVALLSLGVLIATRAGSQTIFRCFQAGMGIFFGIAAILGIIVASNFSKFFVIFHEIFFDNDLWLFDPRTDLMIRMLPEGLFMDFSVRILLWFVGLLAAFEGFLLTVRRLASKKGNPKKAAKTAFFIGTKKRIGRARGTTDSHCTLLAGDGGRGQLGRDRVDAADALHVIVHLDFDEVVRAFDALERLLLQRLIGDVADVDAGEDALQLGRSGDIALDDLVIGAGDRLDEGVGLDIGEESRAGGDRNRSAVAETDTGATRQQHRREGTAENHELFHCINPFFFAASECSTGRL